MTTAQKKSSVSGFKVLSESEIQDRLYGAYLGRPRKESRQTAASVKVVSEAPVDLCWNSVPKNVSAQQWTGEEILAGELKRLREDLIALRRERERLAAELEQHVSSSGGPRQGSGFFGKFLVAAILLGALGTPLGYQILQASPILRGTEVSPYTVQVAIYDLRGMADRALAHLQELGYSAFLVESTRLGGLPRYRIYVGSFVTKAEAQMELEKLTADPRFSDAFVRVR